MPSPPLKRVKVDFIINPKKVFGELVIKSIEDYFLVFMQIEQNFYSSDFFAKFPMLDIRIIEPVNFICNPGEILEIGTIKFY